MVLVKNPLQDLLIQAQILSEKDLKQVLDEQKKTSKPLLETIVDLKLYETTELRSQIRSALELQYGVSYVDLNKTEFESEMIHLLPRNILADHKFVPLRRSGNLVTVAMVDPANLVVEKELAYRFKEFKNLRIKKVVVVEDDFWTFLNTHLPQEEKDEELTLEEDTEDLISTMGVDLVEV